MEVARYLVVLELHHLHLGGRHAPLRHDERPHGLAEQHGSVGVQPLIAAEDTRGMLPAAGRLGTDYQLLRHGIHLLLLAQPHIVISHIVLVHRHAVPQILVAGGGRQQQTAEVVRDVQSCVHHLTAVAVGEGGRWVCRLFTLYIVQTVGEARLVGILIVAGQVEGQPLTGLPYQTYLGTSLVHLVVTLVKVNITEEAVLSAIETSHHEGQFVTRPVVVGHLGLAV